MEPSLERLQESPSDVINLLRDTIASVDRAHTLLYQAGIAGVSVLPNLADPVRRLKVLVERELPGLEAALGAHRTAQR